MDLTSDPWTITRKTTKLMSCSVEENGMARMTRTSYSERHNRHPLISLPYEQKEEVGMIALAQVATVRVLGSSIAKHTNKVVYRYDKRPLSPLSPLSFYAIWFIIKLVVTFTPPQFLT